MSPSRRARYTHFAAGKTLSSTTRGDLLAAIATPAL